jgi:hypothetical protein
MSELLRHLKLKKIIVLTLLVICIDSYGVEFFVSPNGQVNSPGTIDRPFKYLKQAALLLQPGDVCYIREGIYREQLAPFRNGLSGEPIVYQAYEDEKVIISGMMPVSDWEEHEGDIYKASVRMSLKDRNMILFNGELMDLARWPNNTDHDPFTIDALWRQSGTDEWLSHMDIPSADWTGGVLWFLGTSRWTSWRRPITQWSPANKRLFFELPSGWEGSQHSPAREGEFYLMNIYEALDAPGEWYFDDVSDQLYFQAPGNKHPNTATVEYRMFDTAINLKDRSYIHIKDVNVIGAGINMENAQGCVMENVRIRYGNHTIASSSAAFVGDASIKVSGRNNVIRDCHINQGASYGIHITGTRNRIENCLVHDFDWLGGYSCPIYIAGTANTVTRCTAFNGGRDCIRMGGQGHDFSYNDISFSNLINDDCGLLYTCCHDGDGTTIHHNWFHDAESRDTHYKAAGVYLDNDTQTYNVHHNVIWNLEWSAVQINWHGWYLNIFNNTIWNVDHSMAAWHKEGTYFKDVLVYNNLSNNNEWDGIDYQKNLVLDTSPFVSLQSGDFQLRSGTDAIDYGIRISPYTDGFVGNAPDVGAYEYGGETWTAGIDWEPVAFSWSFESETENESDSSFEGLFAYPNPFRGEVRINYSVSETVTVSIKLHNILGQKVKTLINNVLTKPGNHDVLWDGTDHTGRLLADGMYFYTFEMPGKKETKKITLLQ